MVAPFPDAERQALEAKQIVIDVMLLYTPKVVDTYIRNPVDLSTLAIEQANQTFRNSGLGNISLRLVHSQLIDYDESGADLFDHLYRMVDGVGAFKDLKKLRDEKRADIVGLVLDSPTGCGQSTRVGADADEAYFVVHHACAAITYSIAHEVGHILGARHDRVMDANDKPYPFAHGYINGTKWRDMMSYQEGCGGCPRIPYWSNPRIMYQGEPFGHRPPATTPASSSSRPSACRSSDERHARQAGTHVELPDRPTAPARVLDLRGGDVAVWPPSPHEFGPRSIDTGCQRRRPLGGSTVGLTHDIGQRPDSTSASSWPTRRLRAGSKRAEADALWGDRITCGIFSSGLSSLAGSTCKHVEPGAGDPLLLQRLDQRRLGHGRTAPRIDEDGVRLHLAEVLLLEEAQRLRCDRQVHGDEIGPAQHLLQARRRHAVGGDE